MNDLPQRTKNFALQIIDLYCELSQNNVPCQIIGKQFIRSGTSVGAQYREACRARSPKEFLSKIESSLQELDETQYLLELLSESKNLKNFKFPSLVLTYQESKELTGIFIASARTAKKNMGQR